MTEVSLKDFADYWGREGGWKNSDNKRWFEHLLEMDRLMAPTIRRQTEKFEDPGDPPGTSVS